MPGSPAWEVVERSVAEQTNYLSPVLTDSPGVCQVCFGAVHVASTRCGKCAEAHHRSGGVLADVVVPITYRIGYTRQAAHDLRAYKATPSSAEARLRLTCLFWHFCVRHLACVKRRLGIDHFTHVAFVPSTKSPMVTHPLQAMLKPMVPLDLVELVLNNSIDPYSRNLNLDWFKTDPIRSISARPSAVLLIDDTWVTGARVQSAAYCLKEAGAARVATIVLARQINPDYGHAAPLVNKATGIRYDPEICVLHAPAAS